MRAGSLRQRVTLAAAAPDRWDVHGAAAPGATTLAETWAELRSAEYRRANGVEVADPETAVVFAIRWRRDFDRVALVTWGGRRYQVESVNDPDGRRRELELFCRAVAA